MGTWTHKVVRTMPYKGKEYGPRATITVEAGLHKLDGNKRPYFSVTGHIQVPDRRDCETGGCIHGEILRHWPELAPVVALHLSDDTATPMHSEANGWYWLAGYYGGAGQQYHGANGSSGKAPEECLRIFAEHIRVPLDEARHLAKVWQRGVEYSEARAPFRAWLAAQGARFAAERDAAIALLDSMAPKSVPA